MEAKRKGVDPLEPERHRCARVEMFSNHSRDRGSTMNVTTYGLDLAKRVFQVHWVEPETGEVKRKTSVGARSQRSSPAEHRVWWRWRLVARRITGAEC